jgi:hypothetical protein
MKPHCKRMRSSADDVAPARMCAWSSKLVANGEMVGTIPPTSGAGAPKGVHRFRRLLEMFRDCERLFVRPARTAQALPSCGISAVVSLSRKRPAWGSQSRALAALLSFLPMDEYRLSTC